MLLAIDIGNTDFTIGVFQGKKLCDTFRMRTKINRTSDEYGVFILNTLQYKGYDTKDVEDVIIASVVPAVMHSFNSAIIKYFGLTPIVVGPGIRTGIRIATPNPSFMEDRLLSLILEQQQHMIWSQKMEDLSEV